MKRNTSLISIAYALVVSLIVAASPAMANEMANCQACRSGLKGYMNTSCHGKQAVYANFNVFGGGGLFYSTYPYDRAKCSNNTNFLAWIALDYCQYVNPKYNCVNTASFGSARSVCSPISVGDDVDGSITQFILIAVVIEYELP